MSKEEKMVLSHEPVKGYKTIFNITIVVAVIYLGFIFLRCFF